MKKAQLRHLPVEYLQPGKYQARTQFDSTMLDELADSIKAQGLIEPIVVRLLADKSYEIIAGERRWRAAQRAGLNELPCLINDYDDEQAAAVGLIENIQREDLNPIEEALGYRRLIEDFFFQHEDLGLMVGKSRSYVSNALRLLDLDEVIQQQVIARKLSSGHARVLVTLNKVEQRQIANKVISQGWSVRMLEKEVKKLKQATDMHDSKKDRDIERLQTLIAEQCGAQAEIEQTGDTGGWLKLKFYDNDTLAGILDKMGVKY